MTNAAKLDFITSAFEMKAITRPEAIFLLNNSHRWGNSDEYDTELADEVMMLLEEYVEPFDMETVE